MRPAWGRRLLPLVAVVVLVSLAAVSAQEDCAPEAGCRPSEGAALCSGRGACDCGQCACQKGFSGQYCECDDGSCPSPGGLLCGGPGQGRCLCGRCLCQPGWFGEDCSCSESEVTGDSCRPPGTYMTCSGRGSCVCGSCECYSQHVGGAYCECDNLACPRYDGWLCGGPDRGACSCGMCACHPGWQGEACECPASVDTCIGPGTDRVCSDNGVCECGRCRCSRGFSGEYCDQCPTCVGKCDSLHDCVECLAFNVGSLKNRCQTACSHVRMELEDKPTVSVSSDRLCSYFTEDGCRYEFVYSTRGGPLRVQRRPNCPSAGWAWSSGSSGAASVETVLLGLYTAIGCW